MSTYMPKAGEVDRKWYVIDAAGKPLGRVAAQAAVLLRGQGAAHTGEQEQQRDVEPVNKGIRKRTPWMCGTHGHPKGMTVDHQQQANGLGDVDVIQTFGGLLHSIALPFAQLQILLL